MSVLQFWLKLLCIIRLGLGQGSPKVATYVILRCILANHDQ